MKCFFGVDLGSTTTKAVIIDQDEVVRGRGITNSRSNYDVACRIALDEALVNARFTLLDHELQDQGCEQERRARLLEELNRRFRHRQYLTQLDVLGREIMSVIETSEFSAGLAGVIRGMLETMAEEAVAMFETGARRKSDFFRDLAGGRYMKLGEQAAQRGGGGFDEIVGVYDKAILKVENTVIERQFDQLADEAVTEVQDGREELSRAVAAVMSIPLEQAGSVGTGYGRQRLPFPEGQIRSEILCHGLGAHAMFPETRTALDIGGQDTKAIQVDGEGIVTSFQMNDRCAAGCGRYLGYIADEMNMGLHELGPMAEKSERPVKINSTCTVFAGAELRERLSLGEKREDILAGLHRAIILRAMSLLARSGGVSDEFTFTGGVAKNPAAVTALRGLIEENYGKVTMNISPDSIYTGALGAALFAIRGRKRTPVEGAMASPGGSAK